MKPNKIMPIGLFADRKIVDAQGGTERRVWCLMQPGRTGSFVEALFFLYLAFAVTGCVQRTQPKPLTHLERVKQAGELVVVTNYSPSSYYEGPDGYAGLEYDLATLFAKRLGVKVRFVVPDSFRDITRMVESGSADLAAAGLMVTETRKKRLRFAPAYRRVTEQVICRSDQTVPRYITDLTDSDLEVVAGAGHLDTLSALRKHYPDLSWNLNYELDADGLLSMVNQGSLDYAVVQSDQMTRVQHYYPNLQVAFDIGNPSDLAWAFSRDEDSSVYDEAVRFFGEIKHDNQLAQLIDRYYGHAVDYDTALDNSLRVHFRQRLPRYRSMFERAGMRSGLDWRLLAAVAYQESHWDRGAISAEGVGGMMMLTNDTARELKVSNRMDAAQSISGGSTYLSQVLANMPPEIQEPDRTWIALAGYNIGYGHIEDAQHIVRQRGGDPNKWIDIKAVLPLLGKRNWYSKTAHGKARGALAVHYVNSIRRFYDLLVWLTEGEDTRKVAAIGGKAKGGA
jgi:membrane-bound lytic murein transglycosylase F